MKSIGNGWKRAQEAQRRKKDAEERSKYWADYEQTTAAYSQYVFGRLGSHYNHAMTPEQIAALQEPQQKQNAYANHYAFSAKLERNNWTTWERLKRALRTL